MNLDAKNTGILGGLVGLMGAIGLVAIGEKGGIGSLVSGPASIDGEEQFCLISDAPFFRDLEAGCYSKSVLRELYTRDLVNDRGANVVVTMSSPPEAPEASDDCKTCSDYNRMHRLGWFALTGRDQRREEFFRRACGMLDYLVDAKEAQQTFFTDSGLTADDIAAIPDKSLLNLGRGYAPASEAGNELKRENPQSSGLGSAQGPVWSIEIGDDWTVSIQSLSHADFDADGIGDVLVYMRTGRRDGPAFDSVVGYLRKVSATADVEFVQK